MDPYSLPSIQQSSNSNESIVGMPARPSPAGGASSYSKSLPLPPPLSPTKFSSATFPSASTSQAAAPSSRPSTPAGSRALVDDLHDSPDDGSNSLLASSHTAVPSGATGGRKDVRRRAYFADVVLPSSHPSSSSSSSSDELDFLLSTLGDVLSSTPFPPGQDTLPLPQPSSSTPGRMTRSDSVDLTSTAQGGGGQAAGVSKPDSRKLEPLMDEFLTTERTYVRRLNALKKVRCLFLPSSPLPLLPSPSTLLLLPSAPLPPPGCFQTSPLNPPPSPFSPVRPDFFNLPRETDLRRPPPPLRQRPLDVHHPPVQRHAPVWQP